MDLNDKIIGEIRQLGHKHMVEKVILFGSRSRSDNHPSSDIDLAIYPTASTKEWLLESDLDELDTLLKVDHVFISMHTDKALITNIEREGVVIYGRPSQ